MQFRVRLFCCGILAFCFASVPMFLLFTLLFGILFYVLELHAFIVLYFRDIYFASLILLHIIHCGYLPIETLA